MADSYLVGKSFPYSGKTLTVGAHVEGSKSHQCADEDGVVHTFSSRFLGTLFPKPAKTAGRSKPTTIEALHENIKAYGEGIADPTARAAALQDLTTYVISLNK